MGYYNYSQKNGYEIAKEILGKYSDRIKCIDDKKSEKDKTYFIKPDHIGINSTGSLGLISKLWHNSDGNDTMFFSRINEGCLGHPRKIGRIFLGCNVNNENINTLITNIKKYQFNCDTVHGLYSNKLSAELQGILKGKMHRNEYKLQFEALDMSL
ncbi:hypothetical protein L2734_04565 [Parashewanella spongiae]|uniref:hypothetical protein n=1 Tax=Parashewanella spongiae TaxID=342950 RepID=UPI0010593AA8|nr:hypothetical protein [Parashewanella spongiae]MCL1077453.1 hypothetical protein [Parashewanella spongiae]